MKLTKKSDQIVVGVAVSTGFVASADILKRLQELEEENRRLQSELSSEKASSQLDTARNGLSDKYHSQQPAPLLLLDALVTKTRSINDLLHKNTSTAAIVSKLMSLPDSINVLEISYKDDYELYKLVAWCKSNTIYYVNKKNKKLYIDCHWRLDLIRRLRNHKFKTISFVDTSLSKLSIAIIFELEPLCQIIIRNKFVR